MTLLIVLIVIGGLVLACYLAEPTLPVTSRLADEPDDLDVWLP